MLVQPWVAHEGGSGLFYTVLASGLTLWSNGTDLKLSSGVDAVMCDDGSAGA